MFLNRLSNLALASLVTLALGVVSPLAHGGNGNIAQQFPKGKDDGTTASKHIDKVQNKDSGTSEVKSATTDKIEATPEIKHVGKRLHKGKHLVALASRHTTKGKGDGILGSKAATKVKGKEEGKSPSKESVKSSSKGKETVTTTPTTAEKQMPKAEDSGTPISSVKKEVE